MRKQKETFIKMWCLKSSEKKNYHHKKIMKKFQIIAVFCAKMISIIVVVFFSMSNWQLPAIPFWRQSVSQAVFQLEYQQAAYFRSVPNVIPFQTNVTFRYPLKTSSNQNFSDVFRGYRTRKLTWNGIKHLLVIHWKTLPVKHLYKIWIVVLHKCLWFNFATL